MYTSRKPLQFQSEFPSQKEGFLKWIKLYFYDQWNSQSDQFKTLIFLFITDEQIAKKNKQ